MKKKQERDIAAERERKSKRMVTTRRAEERKQVIHERGARRIAGRKA